jgi:charged multivesicular body protein 4A/B
VATAALRRKKASEAELDRLAGTRLQLEMQVNTLESANLNAETIIAMKKAAEALQTIHHNMCAAISSPGYPPFANWREIYCRNMDKVDATMAAVNEQRELANEVAEAISNPMFGSTDVDEVSHRSFVSSLFPSDFRLQDQLREELAELEQVELNEQLMKADHVPVHVPQRNEGPLLHPPLLLSISDVDSYVTAVQRPVVAEDDEDAQLRQLQAELAM